MILSLKLIASCTAGDLFKSTFVISVFIGFFFMTFNRNLSPASKSWFPGVKRTLSSAVLPLIIPEVFAASFLSKTFTLSIVLSIARFCISPFESSGWVNRPFLEGLINQSPTIVKKLKVEGDSALGKISFALFSIVFKTLGSCIIFPWLSAVARIFIRAALKSGEPDWTLVIITFTP